MEILFANTKKEKSVFIECNAISSFSFIAKIIESMESIKENEGSNTHKMQ